MDQHFYPGVGPHWDDEILRDRILAAANSDSAVLDYGAGRGKLEELRFPGRFRLLAGVDIDQAVMSHPSLDEAKLIDLQSGSIPYPECTFDVVFSDNVLEHLEDPAAALREILRVLKPGGKLLAKTPNKFHYVALISHCTPLSVHRWFNARRGRDYNDTFLTYYRCNSPRTVRKLARDCGFGSCSVELVEGRPEYLRVTALTYMLGLAYERLVNSLPFLAPIRCVMIVTLVKPGRA